jgi:3-dehydroquinate dehydratase-1
MICTCLSEPDFATCKNLLGTCEMAEIRMDAMHLSPAKIQQLFRTASVPLIATFRPPSADDGRRRAALEKAIRAGAAFVDVEIDAPYRSKIVQCAKEYQCKVILSYHNFDTTPKEESLKMIALHMQSLQPDYKKITTYAHSPLDCLRVLSLYKTEKNLLAFCMGEAGRFSRIASYSLGAPFLYAKPDEGPPTADGQFTTTQLRTIFK